METAAIFKGVVQNILNRWSGLKLSVEHQSGGRQSKEKALYLIDYINEVLFTNSKIECEDLEDLISDYMDSELETILEDNSVREVSKVILQLFDLFQNGKHDELGLEMNKLPHCDLWLDITYNPPLPVRRINDNSEESSENDDDDDDDVNENVGGENKKEEGVVDEPMDCEWTEVTYRRKR